AGRGKVQWAHPSPAQGGEMATCSQGHSHVTGQGADVCPTGTGDRRIDVEEGAVDVLPSTDRCDVELFHRHLTGLECDLLALTSRFVGTLTVHLDRTDLRGDLGDDPCEFRGGLVHLVVQESPDVHALTRFALCIIG